MKSEVKLSLKVAIIGTVLLAISFVGLLTLCLWPYKEGKIAATEDYTLLYNEKEQAYSLQYKRDGKVGTNDISYGKHREYYHINRSRHYVVVEYPETVYIGRYNSYTSLEKELVWVDDTFRGDVGETIRFNNKTHEMLVNDTHMLIPYETREKLEVYAVLNAMFLLFCVAGIIQSLDNMLVIAMEEQSK